MTERLASSEPRAARSRERERAERSLAAGLLLIGAAWLWVTVAPGSTPRAAHHLLAAAGIVLAAGGARGAAGHAAPLGGAGISGSPGAADAQVAPGGQGPDPAQADVIEEYLRRFALGEPEQRWAAFDQFARESLARAAGAAHVRCYHVDCEAGPALAPLGAHGPPRDRRPPEVSGIIAEALETGCPRTRAAGAADAPSASPSAAPGAPGAGVAGPAAAWPICNASGPIGLITIGQLPPGGAGESEPPAGRRLRGLLACLWLREAALDALRSARRIDKGSGLLTREDFFAAARDALGACRRRGEPAVLLAIGLEGLRALDDRKDWRTRDALVERLGRVLSRRLRGDDVIGRFSDDRYVLLLRRMDGGLGRLLTAKLLAAVRAELARMGPPAARLHVRAGLVGGGQADELEPLLAGALDEVDAARRAGVEMRARVVYAGEPSARVCDED